MCKYRVTFLHVNSPNSKIYAEKYSEVTMICSWKIMKSLLRRTGSRGHPYYLLILGEKSFFCSWTCIFCTNTTWRICCSCTCIFLFLLLATFLLALLPVWGESERWFGSYSTIAMVMNCTCSDGQVLLVCQSFHCRLNTVIYRPIKTQKL